MHGMRCITQLRGAAKACCYEQNDALGPPRSAPSWLCRHAPQQVCDGQHARGPPLRVAHKDAVQVAAHNLVQHVAQAALQGRAVAAWCISAARCRTAVLSSIVGCPSVPTRL